jgi:hypothetical protein
MQRIIFRMHLTDFNLRVGRHLRAPVAAVLIAGLAGLLAVHCARPPDPRPVDAPLETFSAHRAFLHLEALAGSGRPRPNGSAENARARKYLVAALAGIGYAAELHSQVMFAPRRGVDVEVYNVLARLEGVEPGFILLSAHYDSVPAGPGATDDGAGVSALLEVARILRAGPTPRYGILFLFTDAEEDGLLGAHAFQQFHSLAAVLRAAINLDAGGDGGESQLVETGPGNRATVEAFARAVARPAGSSIGVAFKRLTIRRPDSDFAVFKAAGVPGLYFAAVEGNARQHRPADSVENASLATIQHHGENALAMARRLAEYGAPTASGEDMVFSSVFSRFVVRYPVSWAWPVTLLAAVLSAAATGKLASHAPGMKPFLCGILAWVAALASGSLAAIACFAGLGALDLSPGWRLAAQAASSAVAFLGVVRLFRTSAGLSGLWVGALISWNLAGMAALLWLGAEFHHIFAWPALAGALGTLMAARRKTSLESWGRWFGLLPAQITALVLWLPLLVVIARSSGPASAGVVPAVALLFTLAAPPIAAEPRGPALGLAAGWWFFFVAALML